ncbi:MAG: LysM peptidoglycan-binding domain-containing protein [Chitinophagaceae bacterium]
MKKLCLLLVLSIAMLFSVQAQPKELVVKKSSRGLYVEHVVAAKEGLYSIGRLYNVHPKSIAAYNQVDINKGLNVDQVIHIPLTDTNFTQKTNKGIPVYYTVLESQGLMKVSNTVNKVTLKDLRSWNALKSDNLSAGSKLIVGFLVSKEMSALVSKPSVKQTPVNLEEKAAIKAEDKLVVKTVKTEDKPLVKAPPKEDKPILKTVQPEVKEVTKIKSAEDNAVVKTETETPKEIVPEVKEETKKAEPVFVKQETSPTSSEQGYFKKSFEQQVKISPLSKNATVTSGIFKTTSGWQDAKYYLLIDGVPTGTIVKVINPDNNIAVYAKVLGEMNGIRQNEGYDIRISNAAASTLGIAVSDTEKFVLKVNY